MVVRILGSACGLGVEGSGWLAAPNVVVTNAHVVAGTDGDVVVRPRSGDVTLPARALAFDPVNDVAVLAVPGLSGPVLRMVDNPVAGTAGALLGYPRNGPFDVEPARIGAGAERHLAGRLWRGAGRAPDDSGPRAAAPRQLRRPDRRRARAAS